MKIAQSNSNGKESTREVPILSLVPEEDVENVPEDRSKSGSFKLFANPTDPNSSKYAFTMAYVDGTQSIRAHLQWLVNTKRVLRGLAIDSAAAQNEMIKQLCSGSPLTTYNEVVHHTVEQRWIAEAKVVRDAVARNPGDTDEQFAAARQAAYDAHPRPDMEEGDISAGLNGIIKLICPYKALEKQKRFMRRKMRKPADMKTRTYVNHLHRINYEELPLLPPFKEKQHIADDELLDILLYGLPKSWIKEMDRQDFEPYTELMARTVDFCERLELAEDFHPDIAKKSSNKNKKAKKSHGSSKKNDDGDKWCEYHESSTHNTSECSVLKRLKAKGNGGRKKSANKTWKRKLEDAKGYSKKELAAIGKKASKAAIKKAKKELNALSAKRKKEELDDDLSVASSNSLNALDKEEKELDKAMRDFDFDKVNIYSDAEDGEVSC